MKNIYRVTTILISILLLTSGCGDSYQQKEQIKTHQSTKKQSRIVGGDRVSDANAYPWMASLVINSNQSIYDSHFCGGVLIDSNWVVTAAHCLQDLDLNDFKVVLNTHTLDTNSRESFIENGGTIVGVKKIIINPNYGDARSMDSDIGLVQLSESVPFETINISSISNLVGKNAKAIGWGWTNPYYDSIPEELQEVILPINENYMCNFQGGDLTDNMICTGDIFSYKSTSYGDSGGPLVIDNDGKLELVGLTSFGDARGSGYSVFTNVTNLRSFIAKYVDIKNYTPQTDNEDSDKIEKVAPVSHVYGAFSYSKYTGEWGYSHNRDSKYKAELSSKLYCGIWDCEVIKVIKDDECLAYFSSLDGGYYAVSNDLNKAENIASKSCNNSYGDSCVKEFSVCANK